MLSKVPYHISIYFFFLITFIFLTGCGRNGSTDNKLVGKWEHKEPTSGIVVMLEFTQNKIRFSAEGVDPAETSYTYVDEETIKVKNPDSGTEVVTSYTISGEKLTIAFSGEDKVVFTRVK